MKPQCYICKHFRLNYRYQSLICESECGNDTALFNESVLYTIIYEEEDIVKKGRDYTFSTKNAPDRKGLRISYCLRSLTNIFLAFCFGLNFVFACSNAPNDEIFLLSTDMEESSVVSITKQSVTFVFDRVVYVTNQAGITLNGNMAEVSAGGTSLTVKLKGLVYNTEYTVTIDRGAVKDVNNHVNNRSFSLQFTTEEQPPASKTIRIEAENAVISGGGSSPAQIVNDPACSGGKYVDTRESNLTFSFSVSQSGNYKVSACVKSSGGEKINKFRFGGEHTIDVTFHQNNTFEEFTVSDPYYFASGNHTVEMIKSWGWIQFDYLEISPSTAVSVEFDIQPLVTPQPNADAVKLYRFLSGNFQNKIISGVMTLNSLANTNGDYQNEISWLYEKTGKKPALLGLDFMDHVGSLPPDYVNNPDLVQDALTWKNNNGIVAICWHWRDPSHNTYEFYTERTGFDPCKIFEPQSPEYAAMMRDMDIIAGYLKTLQENGVPVLWRPLHEASGGWFWWGSQGAEANKKIWQIMFDRFVNEHGLKNLIWVWTSEANNNALNWYPGDEYVDIIGLDVYDEGNHGSQMMAFEELKRIYRGKKILTLSECGSIPSMEAMKRDRAIWSFYMPWYGTHTKNPVWNSVNDWT